MKKDDYINGFELRLRLQDIQSELTSVRETHVKTTQRLSLIADNLAKVADKLSNGVDLGFEESKIY